MFELKNKGTFFRWPWEPEGSTKGWIVRLLNTDQMTALNRETVTEVDVVIDGALHTKQVVDREKRQELRLDMIIVDWNGLEDDGTVIPCTKEAKVRLLGESVDLAQFLNECLEKLTEATKKRLETVRKN